MVVTDHKPLVYTITSSQTHQHGTSIGLQRYNMTVVYRPGKDNPANYLSRHPDPCPKACRAEMEGKE